MTMVEDAMQYKTAFEEMMNLKHTGLDEYSKLTLIFCLKPVFHFNRIVAKRSVFHCFVNTQAELMTWTQ